MRVLFSVAVGAWVALIPSPGAPETIRVASGADFCAAANRLAPGEELVLEAGDYPGPCVIRRGGEAGAPITIRAADPADRPRILYTGRAANVIEVRASHVRIQGLEIPSSQPGVDGVRMYGGRDVTVEDCRFHNLGGIAVAANHASVHGVVIRGNVIEQVHATGIYLGCQDGRSCEVTGIVIERNVIRHVRAPDPQIGYGLQLKLNSWGVVRDNRIADTKGPGIMVYGANELSRESVVERNFVTGALRSAGIVIGGGPVVVRNNVVVGTQGDAGIALEDYGRRGLLRGVVVAHNSLWGNAGGGISLAGTPRQVVLAHNALHAPTGKPALPEHRPEILALGNVDCRARPCFLAPESLDFTPTPDSALRGSALPGPWTPPDDFFGRPRGPLAVAGAIDRGRGPLDGSP